MNLLKIPKGHKEKELLTAVKVRVKVRHGDGKRDNSCGRRSVTDRMSLVTQSCNNAKIVTLPSKGVNLGKYWCKKHFSETKSSLFPELVTDNRAGIPNFLSS
jgi:hypothetical protein